ncbi:MAG UNVERIFIED_CONTAM: hypothetical protein LVR29_08280 [Microcystis novacekii LVE1205-3]|jgi:nitrate/nitrite transport system substrate-binding protein
MKFWADNASYPYKSHDTWFVTEDIRWGYIPADTDIKALVDKVNRKYLEKLPSSQCSNANQNSYFYLPQCGTFFDGVKSDPENPTAYLKSLKIKKV